MSSHDLEADRRHVRSLLKPGKRHRLNLADDAQHRFLLNHFAGLGKTPQTSPELFRALERTRDVHIKNGGPQPPAGDSNDNEPLAVITGLDSADPTNFVASGLSVYPNGCYYTGMTLQLFDLDTGQPIGQQANVSVYANGEYVPIQATGVTEAGKSVLAELTVSHAPPGVRDGDEEIQSTVETASVTIFPKTPPKSTAPVRKPNHTTTNYVLICLRRSAGNDADCDYGPYGTQTVVVPVAGSITYKTPILPLTTDSAFAQLYIVSRTTGNNTKYFLPGQPITTNFSISSTDPTVLNWTFDVANFGIPDPFANFSFVDIVLQFAVTTQESPNLVTAWVTSTVDSVPGPNLEKILPLQFADGCVAEGTLVTLADGTTRPIEKFEGGEKILSDGAVFTVRFTNSGVEMDLMVQIKDDQNGTLKVTSKHPVLTDNGAKQAHALQVGDSLITETGTAKIVELTHLPFSGRVWNLTLGAGDDEINKLTDTNRNFFANGILVGDSAMQAIFSEAQAQKTENVLAQLPERWHQDFLNSLKQP